jgi:3-(3-hydroxy-phenyl)propionate hydroxylase
MPYVLPVYEYRTPPEISRGEKTTYPVVIAGAGLAGLTAALELGTRGIRTVLLDDDDTVGAAGLSSRGICYAKRSLEILDRFGLAERIRAKGVVWNEGEVYRGEQCLYRFNLQPESDQKFPAFVNLQQFYVEQYLVERLASVAEVDLRWKNRVVGVSQDADSVRVEVETPDGRYPIRAQYLLAADGGHSAVRELVGAQDEERSFYEDRWVIADVRMDTREQAVRKAYLDGIPTEGGAIWYHQMADGVWRTDWQITHLKDPDAEATPERAAERLRKLVGPHVDFELVWVGAWRFKKRLLQRLLHGRIAFLGDAAHEHSPFGARGGNGAIQDANNLAWKLALVLQGRASPDLLETYHDERHFAARDNTENATRSAIFIGPETHGERLFRNAILDLAQREGWARKWVNVGRLSVATAYVESPLNYSPSSGMAALDGSFHHGHFIEQLGGDFCVAWFGDRSPALEAKAVSVPRECRTLWERYGVGEAGATLVFRPDGHVLARCEGLDADFARAAIRSVLEYRKGKQGAGSMTKIPQQAEIDRLYDELAALADSAPDRERALARLVVRLAEQIGDYAKVRAIVREEKG